jgi:hypothetical protein
VCAGKCNIGTDPRRLNGLLIEHDNFSYLAPIIFFIKYVSYDANKNKVLNRQLGDELSNHDADWFGHLSIFGYENPNSYLSFKRQIGLEATLDKTRR